jgi:hypothetical protein
MKEIKTAFRIGPVLSIHEMFEFQDDLKVTDPQTLEGLISEILTKGMAFAPDVWNDPRDGLWKIIDFHHRKKALLVLEERGYTVPKYQTIEVLADSLQEAKDRVLQRNTQYGRMTAQSIVKFAKDAGINFERFQTLRFPEAPMPKLQQHFNPTFAPGSRDDQGTLDKKAGEVTVITCPYCHKKFER